MRLYYIGASADKVVVNPTIGTVDYANGIVNIKNLHITAMADIDFEISIKPSSYDVVSAFTQIAEIARDHLTITAIADETANGDLRAGRNYQHTTSRS
jgi:peptidase E